MRLNGRVRLLYYTMQLSNTQQEMSVTGDGEHLDPRRQPPTKPLAGYRLQPLWSLDNLNLGKSLI